ncbi:MAG: hypothetical protein LBQ90_08270 [Synergistaceae bacterium]|jgi:hypothetical protein|nr:hypothetical protein [Synergistaceae bacterium]
MWNKDTKWRQCSMINVDILKNYNPGLVKTLSEDITYLCVVSHDGDIVNDNMMLEPMVEFIGAKRVASTSPELTCAKHPSLLHIECLFDGEPAVVELQASIRVAISKHNIISAMQPDKNFHFAEKSKVALQNWLCGRYRREMLPGAFVDRTAPLWNYMKNEGKKYVEHVMGYWLDYDPREELSDVEVPYIFSLFIVYSIRHHDAQAQAEKLALEIRNHFPAWKEEAKQKNVGNAELNDCRACAEDCFTLFDLQNCIQIDLERMESLTGHQDGQKTEEAQEQRGSVTLL